MTLFQKSSHSGHYSSGEIRKKLVVLMLLLLAAGVQVAVIRAGRIHWNSDQAVVAIMARDIVLRDAHPVFYYGSTYAGSLEPHWITIFFALLGPSVWAYRIAMMALLALLLLLVYRIARTRFGRSTALAAVSYLAVPPYFFLYKGLTSDGAYDAIAILGGAILYFAIRLEGSARRGEPGWLRVILLGLAAGMGWWVDPLVIYFYLAVAVWFVLVMPSIFRRFSLYLPLLAAFLVAGFPWWVNNFRYSWHSLTAPELAPAGDVQVAKQFQEFWTLGLPILLASRPVFNRTQTYTGETTVSTLLYLIPLLTVSCIVLKNRKGLRSDAMDDGTEKSRVLLLLLLTLLVVPLVVSLSQRSDLAEPRYLFPLYACYPIVFGFTVCELARRSSPMRLVAILLIGLALFSSGRGLILAEKYRVYLDRTNDGSLADLVGELEKRGLKTVYASYWIAYRISFESAERVIGTPFGYWRLVRVRRYHESAALDPKPAFVLWGNEAEQMANFLRVRNTPYHEFSLNPFRVFYNLDSDTVEVLRQNLDIPK